MADSILVVRSGHEPLDWDHYVGHVLCEEWQRRGLSVKVTNRLTEATGPDVLVFPHFDLTKTPRRYREVLRRCARVINRSVDDISKRAISRHLVTSPNGYDGPVIVKTNRNYGGIPEARAAIRQGGARRILSRLTRRLPWTISGMAGEVGYRVYDEPRLVPPLVWFNPSFVVEKFLPEREGELYCLRQYVFLGQCELNTRSVAPDPIVKSHNVIRRELLDHTPPAVREFRARLGFDFGKFDYVMRGDQAIILDVNRTPTYDRASKAGSPSALILDLAPGIQAFLGGA